MKYKDEVIKIVERLCDEYYDTETLGCAVSSLKRDIIDAVKAIPEGRVICKSVGKIESMSYDIDNGLMFEAWIWGDGYRNKDNYLKFPYNTDNETKIRFPYNVRPPKVLRFDKELQFKDIILTIEIDEHKGTRT